MLARRLRVIIEGQRRRSRRRSEAAEVERNGDLVLQPATARALWRERDIGLTITEYKIVVHLVSRKGEPQTYRALYDTAHYEGFVAGSGEHGHNTNVRSLLKRIRRKFLAIDSGLFRDREPGACRLPLARPATLTPQPGRRGVLP